MNNNNDKPATAYCDTCDTCETIVHLSEDGYCESCGKHADNMTPKIAEQN